MKINLFRFLPLAAFSVAGVFAATQPFIKEGIWRGEFTVGSDQVPFNFELKGATPDTATLTLLNGTRRDDFKVTQQEDGTLYIKLNTYDAALVAKIDTDTHLTGAFKSLVQRSGPARDIPFVAVQGQSWRFVEPGKEIPPKADLSGKWAFNVTGNEKTINNVALFKQQGNRITGVTLAVTGDSRELEGNVQGDDVWLSHFSGSGPRLIHGKITADGKIVGSLGRGQTFEAIKDAKADLPDLYAVTYLKDGQKTLDFSFPSIDGGTVSLKDEKYKGKVVIVDILGTWCPNCADETEFLAPWFAANKQRGVEAIGVAFEQKDDFAYAQKTLGIFRKHYGIQYDLVFGGLADKKLATEKLKGINALAAFPTTFIIDRQGTVREIYTGYTGTITGEYYKDYVAKFNALIDRLVAEPNPFEDAAKTTAPAGKPVARSQ
jgi:peroxiredoxin